MKPTNEALSLSLFFSEAALSDRPFPERLFGDGSLCRSLAPSDLLLTFLGRADLLSSDALRFLPLAGSLDAPRFLPLTTALVDSEETSRSRDRFDIRSARRLTGPRTGTRSTNTQPMPSMGLAPRRRPSSNNH